MGLIATLSSYNDYVDLMCEYESTLQGLKAIQMLFVCIIDMFPNLVSSLVAS
jgi:hypothetical protein